MSVFDQYFNNSSLLLTKCYFSPLCGFIALSASSFFSESETASIVSGWALWHQNPRQIQTHLWPKRQTSKRNPALQRWRRSRRVNPLKEDWVLQMRQKNTPVCSDWCDLKQAGTDEPQSDRNRVNDLEYQCQGVWKQQCGTYSDPGPIFWAAKHGGRWDGAKYGNVPREAETISSRSLRSNQFHSLCDVR